MPLCDAHHPPPLRYRLAVRMATTGRTIGPEFCAACIVSVTASTPLDYTVTVRDVPTPSTVLLSPPSGPLRVGDTLNVLVVVAGPETALVPAPAPACCFINGVDVRGTFEDSGSGAYAFEYTVRDGDVDCMGAYPALALGLEDPRCVSAW